MPLKSSLPATHDNRQEFSVRDLDRASQRALPLIPLRISVVHCLDCIEHRDIVLGKAMRAGALDDEALVPEYGRSAASSDGASATYTQASICPAGHSTDRVIGA